jgi:ATP-binding cassette subfamily B protein
MVEFADQVVVLDGGRVVDRGTPAELVARCGWFAQFAASAAGGAPAPGAAKPGEPAGAEDDADDAVEIDED